jgi:hypothetical protein
MKTIIACFLSIWGEGRERKRKLKTIRDVEEEKQKLE